MPKKTDKKKEFADAEYRRLIDIYTSAGVDAVKLKVNDSLIRKVAELFAVLESIKDLPSILFDPRDPSTQRETAAGKMRVKYMAQYTASMQKLNKDMLGTLDGDDDGDFSEYDDDNNDDN